MAIYNIGPFGFMRDHALHRPHFRGGQSKRFQNRA